MITADFACNLMPLSSKLSTVSSHYEIHNKRRLSSSVADSLASAAETATWYICCCDPYKNNIFNSAFTQMFHEALQSWNKLNYCVEDCLSATGISCLTFVSFAWL